MPLQAERAVAVQKTAMVLSWPLRSDGYGIQGHALDIHTGLMRAPFEIGHRLVSSMTAANAHMIQPCRDDECKGGTVADSRRVAGEVSAQRPREATGYLSCRARERLPQN